MKLCIAEKPSVAREIAFIIGARSRQDGYYEGNGYCVSWTFGHLCGLKEPDDYQSDWKKWNLATLPILPAKFDIKLIAAKGVKKQFGILKKLFKQAEVVINCGDAGQEGELIQRWVMQHANYRGKVQRLWISSLTPEAIKDGFRNLMDAAQFDNLYHAGRSRAIGDWLLGMNATRLYTLKYGGYKQVLSIGRVQTPTLAILVERHKEIENFVPQTYWELQTLYREVIFNCEAGKFFKKEEGDTLLQQVDGKPFVIVSFTKKQGREYPPSLFDLTGLQVHCNKRFAFSADQTLKIVQKLYEQKVVTYPRVDTTYLPNDVYPKVSGILGKLNQYSQFVQPLLGKPIRKSKKVFNDTKVTDHHAIIPTGIEKTLPANEQKVYDAIARRFIAACYPDCIVSNTTVIGEVEGVKFKATGKEILEEGWRVLFPKSKTSSTPNIKEPTDKKKAEEERILPTFTKGESGPHSPTLVEKQTKPPKTYTEATLLRAMETAGKKVDDEALRALMKANGIGRPSTRANIIETLFRRQYIERQKKQLIPTPMGIQLIDTIKNELLKSAELTGIWEKQLRDIEEGNYQAENFIAEMKTMVGGLVSEVREDTSQGRLAAPIPKTRKFNKKEKAPQKTIKEKQTTPDFDFTKLSCPKCYKGKLLKGKSAYGCSQWKAGCSFRLPFVYMEKSLPERQLQRLMKFGSTIQLKGFKQNQKSLTGKLRFNRNFDLELEEKKSTKSTQSSAQKRSNQPENNTLACPKCGKGQIIKGKTAYGCSQWQSGCDFRFPFETIRQKAAGRPLTKDLVLAILNNQES
ncbi:MAG: DNA topoisomerase III [Saprospiraceae bacterium]|nr:MAG: DNA topoisomerase III [Saprospiraceae bacterium]